VEESPGVRAALERIRASAAAPAGASPGC
jgi:hypothetical protein